MSQPYVGEIKLFGGNFAPRDYANCDGQLMSIAQNNALFSLLGTTYGGDGNVTFGLPDMRGRIPMHQGSYAGNTYTLGGMSGTETVTLNTSQIPFHNHQLQAGSGGSKASSPSNNYFASGGPQHYASGRVAPTGVLQNGLAAAGGSQPHNNMMPYATLRFIIALFGVYPSRN